MFGVIVAWNDLYNQQRSSFLRTPILFPKSEIHSQLRECKWMCWIINTFWIFIPSGLHNSLFGFWMDIKLFRSVCIQCLHFNTYVPGALRAQKRNLTVRRRKKKKCWENKLVKREIIPTSLCNFASGLGSQAMISIPSGTPLIYYFKVMPLCLIYLQLCLRQSNISQCWIHLPSMGLLSALPLSLHSPLSLHPSFLARQIDFCFSTQCDAGQRIEWTWLHRPLLPPEVSRLSLSQGQSELWNFP